MVVILVRLVAGVLVLLPKSDKTGRYIGRCWKGNSTGSIVMNLTKEICDIYNIKADSYLIIEPTQDGILIKKLDY